jgi:hypothetical protein
LRISGTNISSCSDNPLWTISRKLRRILSLLPCPLRFQFHLWQRIALHSDRSLSHPRLQPLLALALKVQNLLSFSASTKKGNAKINFIFPAHLVHLARRTASKTQFATCTPLNPHCTSPCRNSPCTPYVGPKYLPLIATASTKYGTPPSSDVPIVRTPSHSSSP